MKRSGQILSVLDFGAHHGAQGKSVSVAVSDLAGRASSDLRKGVWLSAAAAWIGQRLVGKDRPVRILELGTCLGSGGVQLLHGCNGQVEYVGLEGSPELASFTADRLKRLYPEAEVTLFVGPFRNTLAPFLSQSPPLDLVFLDGHHEGSVLLDQWRQIRPALSPGALVIVDDIRWSEDMHTAWIKLAQHPSVEALDVFRMGFLFAKGEEEGASRAQLLRAPMHFWA